jgi:hypothetical protein
VQRVCHLDSSLAAGINAITAADAAAVGNGGSVLLDTYGVNRTGTNTGIAFFTPQFICVYDLHSDLTESIENSGLSISN